MKFAGEEARVVTYSGRSPSLDGFRNPVGLPTRPSNASNTSQSLFPRFRPWCPVTTAGQSTLGRIVVRPCLLPSAHRLSVTFSWFPLFTRINCCPVPFNVLHTRMANRDHQCGQPPTKKSHPHSLSNVSRLLSLQVTCGRYKLRLLSLPCGDGEGQKKLGIPTVHHVHHVHWRGAEQVQNGLCVGWPIGPPCFVRTHRESILIRTCVCVSIRPRPQSSPIQDLPAGCREESHHVIIIHPRGNA